jgi:hypothetical protein
MNAGSLRLGRGIDDPVEAVDHLVVAVVELVGLADVVVGVLGVHDGGLDVLAGALDGLHGLGDLGLPGQEVVAVVGGHGDVEPRHGRPLHLLAQGLGLDRLPVEVLLVDGVLRDRHPLYHRACVHGLEVVVGLDSPLRVVVLVVRHPEHRLVLQHRLRLDRRLLGQGLLGVLVDVLGVLLEGQVRFVVRPPIDHQSVRLPLVHEVPLVDGLAGHRGQQVQLVLPWLLLAAECADLLEVGPVLVDQQLAHALLGVRRHGHGLVHGLVLRLRGRAGLGRRPRLRDWLAAGHAGVRGRELVALLAVRVAPRPRVAHRVGAVLAVRPCLAAVL